MVASLFSLNGAPKVDTAIGGTDVIDVASVTARTVLGIDQGNDVVEGSGLTPALVPPVAAAIAKHAGEVTHRCNARAGERRTGVGVSSMCYRRQLI